MDHQTLYSLMKIRKGIGCLLEMFHGGKIRILSSIAVVQNLISLFSLFLFRMFINSVKRLRIMGTSEASGLGKF